MKGFPNCKDELEYFQKLVTGKSGWRILLIEAESGYCKTGLMSCFANQCPKETIAVRLDLKAAGVFGIAYVFYRIRKALSIYRFSAYEAAIGRFLYPGQSEVEIRNNDLSGDQSLIQVVLQGSSDTEGQFRLQQVQSAFFKDLQQCVSPIVFIIDTFDGATNELKAWIEGSFLMEVADNQKLYSVVAGQKVPELSLEWSEITHKCSLQPIKEHAEWFSYSQSQGYPFNLSQVEMAVYVGRGVPREVMNFLKRANEGRQQL